MGVPWQTQPRCLAFRLSQTRKPSSSAADWDARYEISPSVWSIAPNEFVSEYLLNLPVGKMVDVAGGEGRNALAFAQLGWQVENVEFSKVALEKFSMRASQLNLTMPVIANLADARTAQFELEPDLVLFAYLQLPFADLELALNNALSQLKSGILFGVFHAGRNLLEGFGGPQSADLLPSKTQLEDWADRNELDAQIQERERSVETADGARTAIDITLMVRAK